MLELAQLIARACEPPPAIEVARQPTPGRLPARYVPDLTRARDELGIQAREDVDTLVRATLSWLRARRGAVSA